MSTKRIIFIGSMLGITSAFLGNILFLLLDRVVRLITMCNCLLSPVGTISAFLFLCLVTLFPSMFGGAWLAMILYKDCQNQLNDYASSAKKGLFIGAAASMVSNFIGWVLVNGKGSAVVYISYLFETIFIGVIFGLATGVILKKIFLRNAR